MSEPAPGEATATEEKKRGLSKYVSRMKSLLKRTDSSKRLSMSSIKSPTAASSAAARPSASDATKLEATVEETPKAAPAAAATTSAPAITPAPATTSADTPAVNPDLERARKLAAKYNVELGSQDWKRGPRVERVEKPIRMRIHRTCHCCNNTFGASKVCVYCKHTRCEKCSRYPPKKSPREKGKVKGNEAAPGTGEIAFGESASETIEGVKKKHRNVLSIPSKTGGQELVWKRPMQRVRRTCHQCNTLYISPNRTCTGCSHIRCGDCPRDPPKKHKYPYGYPSDVEPEEPSPNSARYSCHTCKTLFKPEDPICSSCGHEKCSACSRIQPRKVNPEPDPEILKRVQERLAGLGLGGKTTTGAGTDPPPEQ